MRYLRIKNCRYFDEFCEKTKEHWIIEEYRRAPLLKRWVALKHTVYCGTDWTEIETKFPSKASAEATIKRMADGFPRCEWAINVCERVE